MPATAGENTTGSRQNSTAVDSEKNYPQSESVAHLDDIALGAAVVDPVSLRKHVFVDVIAVLILEFLRHAFPG